MSRAISEPWPTPAAAKSRAGKRGIQAGSIGRLDNSATIRGTANEGIKLSGTAPGPVTLKNTGTIEGGAAGVDYGQNTIRLAENSGRIAGGAGAGLTAGPITRLDNKAGRHD